MREECEKRDKTHATEIDALKKDMQKRIGEL